MELTTVEILIRLVIAVVLGGLLGLERTLAGKTAGMRTYSMVSLGSALFVGLAQVVLEMTPADGVSPLILASSVITGIGFIGAGLVFHNDHQMKISGLTTAAGLWVAAGVGIASGFGLYEIATAATILAVIIFTIMWFIEKGLKKISYADSPEEKENANHLHD